MPDDTRFYVCHLIAQVWEFQKKPLTVAIYTDNVRSDTKKIQQLWETKFPEHSAPGINVLQFYINYTDILQDIFHAQNRVDSVLLKYHPDYSNAKKELSAVFAKLQHINSYPSSQNFADALKDWRETFSKPSNLERFTEHQLLKYIGTKEIMKLIWHTINLIFGLRHAWINIGMF